MQVSDKGRAFIAAHEGCVLRAYRDDAGVLTIGFGHTSAAGAPVVKTGMRITQKEAEDILSRDLVKFEARVSRRMGALSQNAFDGAVSFDFNTGAIHKATWVKRYLAGKFFEAEASLKLWNKAGGRVLRGLTRRRGDEADIIFRGRYPGAAPETVDQSVIEAQEILTSKGFDLGEIDGAFGPKTKAAVLAYQKLHPDLENDGILGPATLAQLRRDSAATSDAVRGAIKKLAPVAGGGGVLAELAGLPWGGIAFGVAIVCMAAVGVFLWRRRDLVMRRINRLLGREVV